VGAGVEGKITQNWSAKLEYLYMDLGHFSSGPFTLAPASAIAANVSSRFTDHILRAGNQLPVRRPGGREVLRSTKAPTGNKARPRAGLSLFDRETVRACDASRACQRR
jgi:hypothetical protein